MKAVVNLHTWKRVENPTNFTTWEMLSTERYTFDAENLDDAELKVLEAFPAEKCVGYSIQLENKDFACTCVPDYWEYCDGYTTLEKMRDAQYRCVLDRVERKRSVI